MIRDDQPINGWPGSLGSTVVFQVPSRNPGGTGFFTDRIDPSAPAFKGLEGWFGFLRAIALIETGFVDHHGFLGVFYSPRPSVRDPTMEFLEF